MALEKLVFNRAIKVFNQETWLSNIYDPQKPNAWNYVTLRDGESRKEAWDKHISWLSDKIISEPKATETFSKYELMKMGMVGVYKKE